MASFVEDLWNSVFTPGPTSTLLIATNATFAVLQLLLAGLLLATWSRHFVVLSFLSGGLWASINWFAREVQAVQAQQDTKTHQQQQQHKIRRGSTRDQAEGEGAGEAGDELDSADDTETEMAVSAARSVAPVAASTGFAQRLAPSSAATSEEDTRRRASKRLSESTGDVSTDSEWEKVEEDRS